MFLVDIQSLLIHMQMDLIPFLRSSIDFNAFPAVLCTHYFPRSTRLWTIADECFIDLEAKCHTHQDKVLPS